MLRITQERLEKGLSMAAAARRGDLNEQTWRAVESGRLKPWPGQLLKIARALDWPVDRADELMVVVGSGDVE